MTTHAARMAVFNMVELLEAILSSLDSKTLYRVQRISHHWQNVIASSNTLRQKMFLQPLPTLLPDGTCHKEVLVDDVAGDFWAVTGDTDQSRIREHTTLNPIFGTPDKWGSTCSCYLHGKLSKQADPWLGLVANLSAGDSRYEQLVTNPPAQSLDGYVS